MAELKKSENEAAKIVSFEGPKDPSDPLNWSLTYKWFAVILVSMSTTIVYVEFDL